MQEYHKLTLIQKMDIVVCKKQIDEPWSLLSIEGGAELLFGYARKLFVAKSKKGFATWIHADDTANIKMQLQEALANKTPISLVYRLLHKNGKYIAIHEQGSIIWDADKALYSETILSILPEYIPTLPQKEDNKYKALLDASSEGLLIHRNYITLEVNKAFCDMFGYRADEIIGKEIMSQIMARGNDPDIERLLSQLKEMPDFAYQNIMWFKRKDGQKVFVSVKGSNLIIDEEELRCVLFRDITQEVETRQELLATNEKYRSLLSGSREGVVIHDNGIAIEVSPRFAEIIGKTSAEIIGKPIINGVIPEEIPKVMNFLRENENNFDNIRNERTKALHSSGKILDIELWGSRIELNGKLYRYVVIRDISEESKAEREIEQSRKKYKRLSDITVEMVLVHDNGIITEVNRATCEHYDMTEDELIGKHTLELIPQETILMYGLSKEKLEQVYQTDTVSEGINIVKKNGKNQYLQYQESIFYNEGRKLRYVVMRDITNEHEVQLQLEENKNKYKFFADATQEGIIIHKDGGILEVNAAACTLFGRKENELIGLKMVDLADNEGAVMQLNNIAQGQTSKVDRILFCKRNGEPFIAELWESSIEIDGKQLRYTVIRDMTERIHYEQRIEELVYNLSEKNKQLNCLLDLARLSTNRTYTFDQILEQALKIVPQGWQYPEICEVNICYGHKTWSSENFEENIKSHLRAPIIIDNNELGYVEVVYTEDCPVADEGPFLHAERTLIDALGIQLGMLIENKQSEGRVVASILETEDRERTRIAKELHDSLGQVLMAVSLNLESVKKEIARLSDKNQVKLNNALHYLGQAIQESRELAHTLMPKAIGDYGYVLAVLSLIERLGSEDISFQFYDNLNGERLAAKLELALFRITQEALTNILKHAAANMVTIQLMKYSDMLILTIEDNGGGFISENEASSFFGINSMRNRAHSISGIFTLESKIGHGTTIMVEVPL